MRKAEELTALAVSDEKLRSLISMSAEELTELISADFAVMKDYAQNNPNHCYDLLTHTVFTVLNIRANGITQAQFSELRVAALFHDIGKPGVAKETESKTVYYNHAQAGEAIARPYLTQAGFAPEAVQRICFFIRQHDMFIGLSAKTEETEEAFCARIRKRLDKVIKRYADAGGPFVPSLEDFQLLLRLCRADIGAQSKEVYENGSLVNTSQRKYEAVNAVGKALAGMKRQADAERKKQQNVSFFFFPVRTSRSPAELSAALDASGCWKSFKGSGGKLGSEEGAGDHDNARYFLKHVGASFHAQAGEHTVCVQRRLDCRAPSFAEAFLPFSADTVFESWDTRSKAAKGRFRLSGAYLFCFDTDVCLLAVEISHDAAELAELSDSLFLLKEYARRCIRYADGDAFHTATWMDLITPILFSAFGPPDTADGATAYRLIDNWSVPSFQRIFILTYAQTAGQVSEEELFYLSHCYSVDFGYSPQTDDKPKTYRNNEVSTWGFTTEAACCIARCTPENEAFLRDVFIYSIKNGYLLLFVLLLHQKYVLQEFLAQNELRRNEAGSGRGALAREYRDAFYLFEQKYNFRYVSDLAQYQNLYEIVYDAFKIDPLFEDVKEPLEAIKQELDEQEQRQEEENDKKTERALTVLSLFAMFSALTDAWSSISQLIEALSSGAAFLEHLIHIIIAAVIFIGFICLGGPLLVHTVSDDLKRRKENRKKKTGK